MIRIKAPYKHGSFFLNGKEIHFDNYVAIVEDNIAKKILMCGEYDIDIPLSNTLQSAKNILVIREGGIGDILMITPIIRKIKEQNKKCKIDFLTSKNCSQLLLNNPHINNVYSDSNLEELDLLKYHKILRITVQSCQECEKSWNMNKYHRIDCFAQHIGLCENIEKKEILYYMSDDEIKSGTEWVNKNIDKNKKKIMFVLDAVSFKGRALSIDKQLILAKKLVADGDCEVIGVSKNSYKLWGGDNIMGLFNINLRLLAGIMRQMDVIFTPDTGLLHLASALRCKTVEYYGAINWKSRTTNPNARVIFSNIPCYPCNRYECGNPKCVNELDINMLYSEIRKLF